MMDHNKYALCLSGGGFRATVFHLGTIAALRDLDMVQHVSTVSSVSGGSILAAHLAMHWDNYVGEPQAFADAATEVIDLVQCDMRGRITRRVPFMFLRRPVLRFADRLARSVNAGYFVKAACEDAQRYSTNAGLLEKYLDNKLFHGAPLQSLSKTKSPKTAILATNVVRRQLSFFSADGYSPDLVVEPRGRSVIPLARAVAASASFPGFFNPVLFSRDDLGLTQEESPESMHVLTDAGVYDNLGVSFVREQFGFDSFFRVIASDASVELDWELGERQQSTIGTLTRSIDIIHCRSRDLQLDLISNGDADRFVHVALANSADNPMLQGVDRSVIGPTQRLRTDLDSFSPPEITALLHLGYAQTWRELAPGRDIDFTKSSLALLPIESISPSTPHRARRMQAALTSGMRRSLRLFSPFDWVSYVHVIVLAMAALLLGVPIYRGLNAVDPITLEIGSRDEMRHTFASAQLEPVPPADPAIIRPISEAEETLDYSGFQLSTDRRVFDLRKLKPTIPEEYRDIRYSPAGYKRLLRFKKMADVSELRLRFGTTGAAIDARVLGDWKYHIEHIGPTANDPAGILMKRIDIVVDVANLEQDKVYELECEATLWNAFVDSKNEWCGVFGHKNASSRELSVLVLLPRAKPFVSYRVDAVSSLAPETPAPLPATLVEYTDRLRNAVFWRIPNPPEGISFRTAWRW